MSTPPLRYKRERQRLEDKLTGVQSSHSRVGETMMALTAKLHRFEELSAAESERARKLSSAERLLLQGEIESLVVKLQVRRPEGS